MTTMIGNSLQKLAEMNVCLQTMLFKLQTKNAYFDIKSSLRISVK